jgi:hypothetical protein
MLYVVFPKDVLYQILMELLLKFEALKTKFHIQEHMQNIKDDCGHLQETCTKIQEGYIMADIRDEYNQEAYACYDFEADCDDWYMDSFHF